MKFKLNQSEKYLVWHCVCTRVEKLIFSQIISDQVLTKMEESIWRGEQMQMQVIEFIRDQLLELVWDQVNKDSIRSEGL